MRCHSRSHTRPFFCCFRHLYYILFLYYCYYCIYNDIKLYILFLHYCFTMNSLILLIHVSVAYWNKYHQIKPSTLIIPTFAVNTIYEILRQAVPISISEPLSPTLVCVFLRYQFAIFAHKSFLFFSINPFFFLFFFPIAYARLVEHVQHACRFVAVIKINILIWCQSCQAFLILSH